MWLRETFCGERERVTFSGSWPEKEKNNLTSPAVTPSPLPLDKRLAKPWASQFAWNSRRDEYVTSGLGREATQSSFSTGRVRNTIRKNDEVLQYLCRVPQRCHGNDAAHQTPSSFGECNNTFQHRWSYLWHLVCFNKVLLMASTVGWQFKQVVLHICASKANRGADMIQFNSRERNDKDA